jgi:CRISPR-associated endonuclease Csn1
MKKTVLGLDLGTNSIGWSMIEIDDNERPISILGMGSRIIPLSTDDKSQFEKGQAISKNQDRTRVRTQRKGYDRKQLRKKELKKLLVELNIMPTEELMQIPKLELWKLRSDAVTTPISAPQLGRILYSLNQKRGYKSARSEANQDKKETDYVAEVKSRYAQLKSNNQTVGQYFYTELSKAENDNQYFRKKEKVLPREAYLEEFDKIMETQKKAHPFLTDELVHTLREEIIFFQRKLKSQKGLVSVCELSGIAVTYTDKETQREKTILTGPKVAPKTSPLNQLCTIWERVNNITLKVKNETGGRNKWREYDLSLDEKKLLVEYLNENEKLSFDKLRTLLNLKKDEVFPNKQIAKGINGNIVLSALKNIVKNHNILQFSLVKSSIEGRSNLIDKSTGEVLVEEKPEEIDASCENEPLYQLWHTIYAIQDLDECKKALIKRFGLDESVAENLSKLDFNKQGYANKSNKAIRKILPYLMRGYVYSESCELAGFNHSNSLTKKEQSEKQTNEYLELLPKNSLRQPVVEKILNQMINVVNGIISAYGIPTKIRVELARQLKQSKDERSEDESRNYLNGKINEEVKKRLSDLGLTPTKTLVQKYKFIFPTKVAKWSESQVVNQCIYCGKSFNLKEALDGDSFDVDHIIPKALLFDDSQTNKVLVHRSCNASKTNKTAFDYIASKGQAELDEYIHRVENWYDRGVISYGKMERLKVSHEQYIERKKKKKETEADKKLWESFINRQLRETQYISKKSIEILGKISNNVFVTEGGVTAELRKLWGWNDVLMNLQLPKYKELGQTEWKEWTSDHGKNKHKKEQIVGWTKRDDHRHHAVDALVVACTKQSFIQRINTLNASEVRDEMTKEIESSKLEYNKKLTLLQNYLGNEKPFNTEMVMKEAEQILVSFKAGKKTATYGVRKIKKNGKKVVVQENILTPRGALHEQSVYGKIQIVEKSKSTKYLFENSDMIIDSNIKKLVITRIEENNKDIKKALNSLKKEPIFLDEAKKDILEKADCFSYSTVLKYPIQNLKINQIEDVVDEKVKQLLKARIEESKGNLKEAFKNSVWFNEKKQIPIKTVRIHARPDANSIETIKKDNKGNAIGFAVLGNNHHIAIYEDENNNTIQHMCTFWDAVERKKHKLPVIINDTRSIWNNISLSEFPESFLEKLPNDNLKLKFSMQQNEMFVLGLTQEDFNEAFSSKNYALISKHLYLVWSLATGDFWFRHHLETKNTELKNIKNAKESKRFYRLSLKGLNDLNPIKIRINHLGEITKIGEQ